MTAPLLLETHLQGRTLVVRPVGELLPETHARLRDGLLECAAEEPREIVVDLAGMRAATASLLTVFATVRSRINEWPGVPLVLAAARQPLRALLNVSAVPRFVPTYGSVGEAQEALEAAPPRRRRQVQLACAPTTAQRVRRLVEQTCREWGIPSVIDDAMVVASELTDNMVSHARSDGWLRLELRPQVLTVAVADTDPRPPRLRVPGHRAGGGRGLVLVDKLSRTWGTAAQVAGGKVVWALLAVPAKKRS
jgi:anti-sigma regulatory factor (Ser/Thr protein kinase)